LRIIVKKVFLLLCMIYEKEDKRVLLVNNIMILKLIIKIKILY